MTLAKRIRDCRYAKGWGPDELASRADISRTALYQIESGKTETPRAATLRRIAKALGVSTDELLGNHPLEASARLGSDDPISVEPAVVVPSVPGLVGWVGPATVRNDELDRKFHILLESPLGEGISRIIEEAYRLLIPNQGQATG